jgi:hypothetical protein
VIAVIAPNPRKSGARWRPRPRDMAGDRKSKREEKETTESSAEQHTHERTS